MHTYLHPITGAQLPSVTTILEDTMSESKCFALAQHYAKSPQSYLKNAESRRRGIQVDRWCKAYLLGVALPEIDFQFMPWCHQLKPEIDRLRVTAEAVLSDEFVYTDHYAGMLDLAICNAGTWTVLDIKTKSHFYLPAIDDHKLQVAAYAHALQQHGYRVTAIGLLVGTKSKCESIRVDNAAELQAISQQWQARLSSFLPHAAISSSSG